MAVFQQNVTYKIRTWVICQSPGLTHKKGKRSDETAEGRGLNDITQEACQSKGKNG